MAFKAINDIVGLNSIILTLLVYGTYLQITKHDPPLLSVTQRALTIKKAMAKVQKLRAKRQVNNALNIRNSPNTLDIYELALNSDVLVQREPGAQKGPYKLVAIDRESCTLALPYGNTTFRATSVKLYLVPDV